MKIRIGFVSNSSTSSFLIYGVCIDNVDIDEIEEAMDAMNVLFDTHNPYGENTYIGISWEEVKDDETGAQFKARVQKAVNTVLDKVGYEGEREFSTHEEAYND